MASLLNLHNPAADVRLAQPRAVVLLSGGINSVVAAAHAVRAGYLVTALTVDYGQRARDAEVAAAAACARRLGVAEHTLLLVRLGSLVPCQVTGTGAPPRAGARPVSESYVPGLDLILLSLAVAHAEATGAEAVVAGHGPESVGPPPASSRGLFEAMAAMCYHGSALSTRRTSFKLEAPLVNTPRDHVVKIAADFGVDLSDTCSCHAPGQGGVVCNRCDGCLVRRGGFATAGLEDPAGAMILGPDGQASGGGIVTATAADIPI